MLAKDQAQANEIPLAALLVLCQYNRTKPYQRPALMKVHHHCRSILPQELYVWIGCVFLQHVPDNEYETKNHV